MKNLIVLLVAVLFSAAATAQSVTFDSFLQQFPKATLPFTLGEQDLRSHLESRATNAPINKAKRLAWEYYEFLPMLEEDARENRMPVYPEPIATFETAEYHAVVFNTGRTFARQYKTYHIAVFTKEGKFVSSRCIAGVNPTALASATIDANLHITIKEYSVNWSKDFSTNGFEGNTIVGITPTVTREVDATTAVKAVGEDWQNNYSSEKSATAAAALTAQAK